MSKLRKIIARTCFGLIIFLPVAAFAHFIVFPFETRSILIDYSDFKKEGRIYYNAATAHYKIDSLKLLINQASIRTVSFWGVKKSDPKFIYCDTEEDSKKYCVNPSAPAVTYLKLGSVIVLSAGTMDLDIIAHEFSHAELYERIGFYKFNYKIPAWFKHGLAMQADYRDYYSEDTLKVKSRNFSNLPDVTALVSDEAFYAGSLEQIMLNYMAAKHEIKNWYSKAKLDRFIKDLQSGKTFEEAFGK